MSPDRADVSVPSAPDAAAAARPEGEVTTDPQFTLANIHEWAGQHRACWEIVPLREMVQGHGVERIGYELCLFAEAQLGAGHAGAEAAYEHLRAAAERLRPCASPLTHVDIEPFDASFHLRPETSFAPEVQLTVRATPAHSDRRLTPEEVHALIGELEERLEEMGFRPKVWGREGDSS